MSIHNNFAPGGSNAMVDKLLGKSYDVVKAVYQNLETIQDFKDSVDIEQIEAALPTLKETNSNMPKINEVHDNLAAIKEAPANAKKAEEAINTAVSKGSEHIEEAKELIQQAKTVADQFDTAVDIVVDNMDSIKINASNIGSINTNSENIEAINKVADYFNGVDDTDVIPESDLGVIGTDDDSYFDGTTALEVVAKNIYVLESVYENLEDLLEIAQNGGVYKLIELADKINGYLEEIRGAYKAINEALGMFDDKVIAFDKHYGELLKEFTSIRNDAEKRITEMLRKMEEHLAKADTAVDSCNAAARECASSLLEIREAYKLTSEALDQANRKYLHEIRATGDSVIRKLHRETDSAIDRAQTAVDTAVKDVIDDIQCAADKIVNNTSNALDKIATEKLYEFQTRTDDITQNSLDEIERKKDASLVELESAKDSGILSITKETEKSLAGIKTAENDAIGNITVKGDEVLEQISNKLINVYKFKGSVPTVEDLPMDAQPGDVYNVEEDGNNYAWLGTKWDSLGPLMKTDLGIIGD